MVSQQQMDAVQAQLTQALTQIAALQNAQAAPAAARPYEPKISVDLLFKEGFIALNPDGKDPLVLNLQEKIESIMTKVNLQTGNKVSLERLKQDKNQEIEKLRQDHELRTRELENALGDGVKRVEDNEKETVILQRRALHCSKSLAAGHIITNDDLVDLRPCPVGGILPFDREGVVGKRLKRDLNEGEGLRWQDLS